MSPRSRSRPGEGSALRDELLEAALAMLTESDDPDALTVRAIAERVGVSQPALYLHFQSRDELLYEVAFRHYGVAATALEDELAGVDDALERVDRRGEHYIRYALANPKLFHVLLMGDGSEKTPTRFDGYERLSATNAATLIADVQAAMDQGSITPGDPRVTAMMLWMGVHGCAALQVSIPGFPWPDAAWLSQAMRSFQRRALTAPLIPPS